MKSIGLISFVGILSLLLICAAVSSSPMGEGEKQAEVEEISLARSRLSYKTLFNFDNYLKAFGKRYKSVAERMIRMKNYLANAYKTFISWIAYQNHISSSYLRINERSDWTQEEVKRMYMPLSEPLNGATGSDERDINERAKVRSKREIVHRPEKSSDKEVQETISDPLPKLPDLPPLDEILNASLKEIPPDKVFIDHRQSGCITAVRNQGLCGSCYAFATIAMFEWLLCNQTGVLNEYSEQYMVDCGHLTGLGGCRGGSHLNTGRFVNSYGLELLKDYPYTSSDASINSCPLDGESGSKKFGLVRISVGELEELQPYSNKPALDHGPLLASVAVNTAFHQYGGGVDDAVGCGNLKGSHAMLVVGRGRENGKEYWIYKNSFGPDWGEQGYYRMNRYNNCTLDGGSNYMPKVKYLKIKTGIDHFEVIPNWEHKFYKGDEFESRILPAR